MKFSLKKKVIIALEMDSSEAVMFCRGGRQDIKLEEDLITLLAQESKPITIEKYDGNDEVLSIEAEYFITVQLKDKDRFDWITSEAIKHKNNQKET